MDDNYRRVIFIEKPGRNDRIAFELLRIIKSLEVSSRTGDPSDGHGDLPELQARDAANDLTLKLINF